MSKNKSQNQTPKASDVPVPALTWRLVGEPQSVSRGESGLPLDVDISISTNNRTPLYDAAKEIVRRSVAASVASTLEAPAGEAEAAKAEEQVTVAEQEIARLQRELTQLKTRHACLVNGDVPELAGVELARELGANEQAQRQISQQVSETGAGLATLRRSAADKRRVVHEGIAASAAKIAQEVRAKLREDRERLKTEIAPILGSAFALYEMYVLACDRCTEHEIRSIVAQVAGISLPEGSAPPCPPLSPSPPPPPPRAEVQLTTRKELPDDICKQCMGVGLITGADGQRVRCSCQPPRKNERPQSKGPVLVMG